MKFQRDINGNVFVDENHVFTLPKTGRCDLKGIEFSAEDHYEDDNFILLNGNPIRKRFKFVRSENGNIQVWLPNLQDLKGLENRYQNICQKISNYHKNVFHPAYKELESVGFAHVSKPKPGTKFYKKHMASNGSFHFNWVENSSLKNTEIGDNFDKVDKIIERLYQRRSKFRIALEKSIHIFLDIEKGSTNGYFKHRKFVGQQVCLNINERNYWYHVVGKSKGSGWEIISWPNSKLEIMKV